MTKRTARTQRTQAKNGAGPAPLHLVEPMLAGMTTTRQHLLAWVHAHGLAALDELFREEAVALAGPKGRHQRPRTHHHWGTAATELTFGGRRVQVRRPRVRPTIGGEATLPSVAAFRDRDPLTARMMQQLLAGVSMRDYEGSLEARPSGRPTRGSSKSAVSRTVVRGLTRDGRVLWVIDGGKGLRKALGDVLGDAAVIQRCQLHSVPGRARSKEVRRPPAGKTFTPASQRQAVAA